MSMVNRMFYFENCEDGDILSTIRLVLMIINVVKIVLPVLITIFAIRDFSKAAIGNSGDDLKAAFIAMLKKLFAGLVVFLIPTFVGLIADFIPDKEADYHLCVDKATPEGIKKAYETKARYLVSHAKETLEASDLRTASSYLNKVEDEGVKKELEKQIEQIQKYIDIRNEIIGMTHIKQYKELKAKIDKISDADVKKKLDDELEAKFKSLDIHDVAKVNVGGTLVRQEETDTLKVYIKQNGSYYITQVWVERPYSQLNKQDSPQYGKSLYKPSILLQNAINEKGLSNKLIVGFNASGFYLKDVYDAASVNYYPAYDKTSVGSLVITDGKVVRNAYNKAYKTWYIAGVDGTGTFRIFTDEKTNDIEAKKKWADSVSSSIRNSFTFASPLVMNGAASNETTSMPSPGSSLNRQAMCQIDKNNFILITGGGLSRTDLINIMLSANCRTGTNFDGGGSIALLYKPKNSTSIETIIGNGRSLTEVGYFTE